MLTKDTKIKLGLLGGNGEQVRKAAEQALQAASECRLSTKPGLMPGMLDSYSNVGVMVGVLFDDNNSKDVQKAIHQLWEELDKGLVDELVLHCGCKIT